MARSIKTLPADALWEDWRTDIERITADTHELFVIRRQFMEIGWMFERNPHLRKVGGNLWVWLRTVYAAAVLVRLRREVDNQPNSVNLRTLLEEIEKRPDVITRGRIAARSPNISERVAELNNEGFSEHWATELADGGAGDQIDPDVVRVDRQALEKATSQLDEIVSRTLAHRARRPPDLTAVPGVESIFQLVEDLLTKYLALLTGAALINVEPTPQFDASAPFMFPWHPSAYEEWRHLKDGANG